MSILLSQCQWIPRDICGFNLIIPITCKRYVNIYDYVYFCGIKMLSVLKLLSNVIINLLT